MKQYIGAGLLVFTIFLTMTGCASARPGTPLENAKEKIEEAEDSVERAVRRAVTPAPAATPSNPVAVPTQTVDDPITREGAEQIALESLGLARDQVKRLHTVYEIDDGVGRYDVQFVFDGREYEFEIHAGTGKILSYDKDHRND